MVGLFRSIKRAITGEVIRTIDTEVLNGSCKLSLRLKRERGSNDRYVVLAGIASGNYQYYVLDRQEFGEFAQAIKTMQAAMDEPA